ncbi:unnamed protein product [Pleuronectes platessa]|uniref:Immunoglobulin V-set domain-containing protein n=1 Tax=Pleuronectes platessa TaxID=8262 RepID=A0A9N7VH97_PLEPL|nr:unnamed protein product [Pleuronectes platessa]
MTTVFLLSWLIGVCLGLDVRQSPSDLVTNPGDNVQISCSHDRTDYTNMPWYQRSPGDTAMKLIGYLNYQDATMEASYDKNFEITGDLRGTGISLGVQVHQSPSALIRKAGDAVQLICTHGQTDYTVMLWYQQSPRDQALKLIGYVQHNQII